MRSGLLAGALCAALVALASCGRGSGPADAATPAAVHNVPAAPGCYSLQEIGSVFPDYPWFTSLDVNTWGVVVGTMGQSSDPADRRAFVYRHGPMLPLGDLGGLTSVAQAVNDWGYAVGGSLDGTHWRAASFFGGKVTDLGSLDGTHSNASAVNNFGYAVGNGWVTDAAGVTVAHAAGFFRGKAFDLGFLGGDTYANGVNDLFEVVGTGWFTDGSASGFVVRNGRMLTLDAFGVPRPSDGHKINDRGTICGSYGKPDGEYFNRSFLLFRSGRLVELKTFADLPDGAPEWTYCLDLSENDVAVGAADAGTRGYRAVAWLEPGKPPVDLNSRVVPLSPGVQLYAASGISSSGMITAFGWVGEDTRGYLLKPTACRR